MEIVADILSRLPAKCLLKLRCVCMQWNTLLNYNHHFILEHHRKALRLHPMLICSTSNHRGTIPLFCVGENKMKDCSAKYTAPLRDRKVSNPVHGLVCLCYEYDYDHYLLNPSTMEIACLPEKKFRNNYFSFSIGLGYDEDKGVYKIVKVANNKKIGCLCELLIIGAENWRFLDEISVEVLCDRPCCFFNGKLHWLTLLDKHPLHLGILSFDMKKEKFDAYPISIEFDRGSRSSEMALKEYENHFYLVQGSKESIRIWELIKCSDTDSFSGFKGEQVFHVDMSVYVYFSDSKFQVAYADVKGDDFLFHNRECLYHFRSGKLRKVYSFPYLHGKWWLSVFTESLVSPQRLLIRNSRVQAGFE